MFLINNITTTQYGEIELGLLFEQLAYSIKPHSIYYQTSTLRELLFTLTCTRAFALGKGENYLRQWKFKELALQ